jgi:hypothetical protein
MRKKITIRDLVAFLLGMGLMILIQFFSDFKNNINNFREGFNEGYSNAMQEKPM